MFGQQQGCTYPFRFRFLAHFTLTLEFFFLCQNIGWRYRRGGKKNSVQQKNKNKILFFFAGRSFLRPPFEWRPRRPPIPPVGKTPLLRHIMTRSEEHTSEIQ